jgi:alkylation response protein AidB-like acyl-CoA dehydrogenase
MLDDIDADGDEITRMLRESAAGIAGLGGGVKRARGLRFGKAGFDRQVWTQMAEMGWLGLCLPEEAGGLGLGMSTMTALVAELGATLVPEPLVETMLSLRLLAAAAPDAELTRAVLAGDRLAITAWAETADGLEVRGTTGPRDFMPSGAAADVIVVPFSHGDGCRLVACDAATVTFTVAGNQDGGYAARADASWQGDEIGYVPAGTMAAALDEAALATAAYLNGLAGAAFEMTLDYLRTRKQFGRAIGSFQALQHRAADQKIELELARAGLDAAAREVDATDSSVQRALSVSRAKARSSDMAMSICRAAIQMHGGIGYTDEHDIGLYVRKALVLVNAFGSARWHRRRYARLMPRLED